MLKVEENNKFQEAIIFLRESINISGKNPKNVVRHSLETADYLYERGYSANIVIGVILHDLIEDTAIEADEIEGRFGKAVRDLVEANSFDENIPDEVAQYQEMFARCLKAGKDALIIKAADILNNSNYYDLATPERKEIVLKKWKYFIDVSAGTIKNEVTWQDLNRRYGLLHRPYLRFVNDLKGKIQLNKKRPHEDKTS